MARDLTVTELLGALVATQNITLEDCVLMNDYATHVGVQYLEPAETLEEALDMALDFFNEPPDVEAAKQEAKIQAIRETPHDPDACPDCGGPMLDDADFEQALDLWHAVRGICDKYNFDMFADHDHGPDAEEC